MNKLVMPSLFLAVPLLLLGLFLPIIVPERKAVAANSGEPPMLIIDTQDEAGDIQDIAFEGEYIWAATTKGVVRWHRDDHSYLIFTEKDGLVNNNVTSVVVDNEGNKWFGTHSNGISKYDGSGWISYYLSPNNLVRTMKLNKSNGHLLIGTSTELLGFDGHSFYTFPDVLLQDRIIAVDIKAIEIDRNNDIWIGTASQGAFLLQGIEWKLVSFGTYGGGTIADIREAPDGSLWFAFYYHGDGSIGQLSGSNFTRYRISDGLVSNDARALDFDHNGRLWAGFRWGINQFDGAGWTSVNIMQEIGLEIAAEVTVVRADQGGQIWFAARGYLFTFDGNEWDLYMAGLPADAMYPPIQGTNDEVWFPIDRGGLARFDGSRWDLFTRRDGLPGSSVRKSFRDANGHLWFAFYLDTAPKGVSRFDGQHWSHYSEDNGLVSNAVHDMDGDENGNVWFATNSGVNKFDGVNWTTYTQADGLIGNRARSIGVDGENVWVGFTPGALGISHFDGQTWTRYDDDDGIESDRIYAIVMDAQGDPWFATNAGVSTFDGQTWQKFPYPDYFFRIYFSYASDMVIDSYGAVWLTALANNWTGLNRLHDGEWAQYSVGPGVRGMEVYWLNGTPESDVVWFYSSGGVGSFSQRFDLNEKLYFPIIQ